MNQIRIDGNLQDWSQEVKSWLVQIYVVLAGHDMITGADKATPCRCKFKAPLI